jgi:hypothetical protein
MFLRGVRNPFSPGFTLANEIRPRRVRDFPIPTSEEFADILERARLDNAITMKDVVIDFPPVPTTREIRYNVFEPGVPANSVAIFRSVHTYPEGDLQESLMPEPNREYGFPASTLIKFREDFSATDWPGNTDPNAIPITWPKRTNSSVESVAPSVPLITVRGIPYDKIYIGIPNIENAPSDWYGSGPYSSIVPKGYRVRFKCLAWYDPLAISVEIR